MSRLILVPHSGGLIDYKGEIRKLFIKTDHYQSGNRIFDYFGGSDETVWATYTPPAPVQEYRTVVTGQELMDLFDNESPDIWMAIEGLTQAGAIEFRDMIGRRLNSPIDLNHSKMVSVFAQMVAAGVATQEQVDRIKLGVSE